MAKNYYKSLGLTRTASVEEIKAAYKKLAVQFHPDKNPGDIVSEDRFKEIAEAYGVLGDEDKKKKYDGTTSFSMKFRSFQDLMKDGDVDVFNYTPRPKPPKGPDIEVDVTLTLEEIFRGSEKFISIKKNIACPLCDATGAKTMKTCLTCSGSGVTISKEFKRVACGVCFGAKVVPEVFCGKCGGQGCFESPHSVKVKIPRGMDGRNALVQKHGGHAGIKGGECGDLLVHIIEVPHARFTREGLDLFTSVDLNISDLVLGGTVKVPTLKDTVEMKIIPGTPSGKQFRIRGMGLQKDDVHGNLYVTVNVIVHAHLTDEQRFHYESLRKIDNSVQF